MKTEPYFLTNEAWYRLKEGVFGYELTPAGRKIPEVVASYEEFYSTERDDDDELVDA